MGGCRLGLEVGMLLRVLVAVVAVIVTFALLGPVSRILGFPVTGDVETVFRVVVAGLAVLYILRGRPIG